ncbi:hypothetical protein [Jiella sonneratiae]|uniref:Uncharacterized protein n=1 Tax=Jiella sonneratiae TaxID=2816856 RepID=A0ABS3J282_9HYPH|nr:hypothetical protein [Jiella sonneratiae]MBO0903779.1 hypothetical protein [Jiella sonneratiae]
MRFRRKAIGLSISTALVTAAAGTLGHAQGPAAIGVPPAANSRSDASPEPPPAAEGGTANLAPATGSGAGDCSLLLNGRLARFLSSLCGSSGGVREGQTTTMVPFDFDRSMENNSFLLPGNQT